MVQARRAAFTWAVGDAPSGGEASFLMENPRSGRLPHAFGIVSTSRGP
jgi:hypothetical protein